MADFQVTYTFVANTKARSAEVNQNFTDLLNFLKAHHHDPNLYTDASPITTSGMADNANIQDTQLQDNITRSGLINPLSLQVVTVPKGGTGFVYVTPEDLLVGNGQTLRTLTKGGIGTVVGVKDDDTVGYINPSDKAVVSLEAYEALSAGDPIKTIMNSGVANFAPVFGLASASNSLGDTPIDFIKLSATTVVAMYQNVVGNTQSQRVRVGTISGHTISWGTAVTLRSENTSSSPRDSFTSKRLVRMSDTSFVAVIQINLSGGGIQPDCFVCTVSGSTITAGSAQNFGLSGSPSNDYTPLDAVICQGSVVSVLYIDSSLGSTRLVAGTVDESLRTISAGSPLTVYSGSDTNARVHYLSENRLFGTYNTTGYRVMTVSGTTITSVNTGTITGAGTGFRFQKGGTDNEGLAVLQSGASKDVVYLSESGGTISISLNVTLAQGVKSNIHSISCYDEDSNMWIVLNNTTGYIQLLTLNTSSGIDAPDAIQISGGSTIAACYDKQKFVFMNGGSPIVGSLDWLSFFGFANTSVAQGETVDGNGNGLKDLNQSGLIPATIQYLRADGVVDVISSYTLNSVAVPSKQIGRSYGSTSMLVMTI